VLVTVLAMHVALLPLGGASAQTGDVGVAVVAEGLLNPKHIQAFGPGGAHVAEAGVGGDECFAPEPEEPA
jgi:hypothetical protein